ncbi:cyclin-B3-1 [Pyrus ussuriensis x Pyrus communis]|uniref:B-like cyclin n=1 Tax=Pyrus ussuriensis x Pyrus communis TaxID=2448454 RepID=A0A5N5ICS9_9ROSA|nr:cyclin-B3-1 [Pyrus ussuriensis x Pyrus communis]
MIFAHKHASYQNLNEGTRLILDGKLNGVRTRLQINDFGKLNSENAFDIIWSYTVGVSSFKVYTESDTAKADAGIGDATVNKVSAVENAASLKAGLKSMEKQKGILGSSSNANVGRRALADVSNGKSNSSRIVGGDASKRKSGKGERINLCSYCILLYFCRVSVGTGVKTVNLSSRISLAGKNGKGRESFNSSEMLVWFPGFNSIKELKAPSENQRTKAMGLNRESIVTDGRRTSNTSLKLITKSLLVLRVNPEEASIPKENAGRNSEGKRGYYVVPRVNDTTRSHLLRNRVSDIFAHESQRTLISKGASRPNKLVSATATSSKTEKVATSLPENFKHEATQGELPSEANCSQSASTIKSNRRRSYTSLLMTGSKPYLRLLEDRVEASKAEELPSIDDDCNQPEVSDYVDEIYQYYWVSEAQNPPPENFMSIQAGITNHMRGILVNWLIEKLCLMVTVLDQHLSQVTIKKDDMQLVGITALLLASKYEDFWHPRVKNLISILVETYTRVKVLGMKAFLKKLKFRLNAPTPYVFVLRFLKAAQSETKVFIANRLLLCGLFCSLNTWFYLIELCLVEYEALRFKPSLLCAAALSVARCTQQITPAWTPLVTKYPKSGTALKTNCAEMVLRFHKAARVGILKVTYEKYSSPDLSGVCSNKTIGDTSPPIQLRGVEIRMLTIQEIKTSASSSRLVFPFIC